MGFGLVNRFIDHLYTPLGTTSNYSAITDLHTPQFITARTKSFPAYCVSNSRSLATASSSGDSSASHTYVITVWRISLNWTLFFTAGLSALNWTGLPSLLSLLYTARFKCQPSTMWVPGWRPYHTNLPVFSSQADFQLTTEHSHSPTNYFTSLHFTQLNWST
jgi:hypothetical protein